MEQRQFFEYILSESPQAQSPQAQSPQPGSPESLSRSETKLRFIQELGGEEIEPNIYCLTKPYFETCQSLEDNDPDIYRAIQSYNLQYDYCNGILSFKTSTPQTKFVNAKITSSIMLSLYHIKRDQSQNPGTIKLAGSIHSSGVADIEGEDYAYQPSCQIRLFCPLTTAE